MTNDAKSVRRVAILGAQSGVAEATARLLAAQGCSLALAGRNAERLEVIAADLRVRGAERVSVHAGDLLAEPDKSAALGAMAEALGGLDGVMLFYGVLGDQAQADSDTAEVRRIIEVNFTSAAEWLTAGATLLQRSDAARPALLAVSSVAGDRGRMSNYAYGAAKGGLALFVQGMAHRLAAQGRVRATAVKLGFVKTQMTAHMDRKGALWAEPDVVAKSIVRALHRGAPIVYAPFIWRWIMLIIRLVPSPVFHKTKL